MKILGMAGLGLIACAALMGWHPHPAGGQESWVYVGPFHGNIGLDVSGSSQETRSGGSESKRSYYFTNETVNLNNRVVIYDHRFIDLNWGAGLTLGQGHGDSILGKRQVIRYSVGANFLKTHPYSLNLFSQKSESETEQTPAVLTTVKRRSSGGSLQLKPQLGLPLPLNISYSTSHVENENVVDSLNATNKFSENEKRVVVLSTRHWEQGSLSLEYRNRKREIFRIQTGGTSKLEYEQSYYRASANGRAGGGDRLRWRLDRREDTQDNFPKSTQTQSFGESRFKIYDTHASSLDSLLTFDVNEQERDSVAGGTPDRTVTEHYRGALDFRLFRSLYSNLEHSTQKTTQPTVIRRTRTSKFGLRYLKKIPGGNLSAFIDAALARIQSEGARVFFIYDEDHALVDFTPTQLLQSNIDPATIVVTDLLNNSYFENVDYRVVQNGLTTSIERIPGTSILNGETVLVDYDYSTPSGVMETRTRAYGLGFRWKFMEPFWRVTVFRENLLEGDTPDQPLLNPGRVTVYGLKLRETFRERFHPQATAEREHSTRLLAPFHRYTRSATLGIDLTFNASLAFHYTRTLVDHLKVTASDPGGTMFDSDATVWRTDFHFTHGKMNGALEVSKEDSQVGETDKDVLVRRAIVNYTVGAWLLAATIRQAEERFVAASNPYPTENSLFSYTLSARRSF